MSPLAVLWRRKLVILATAGASVVIALAVTLALPATYRATSTVLIMPPGYRPEVAAQPPSAETYKEIALTPAVIEGALERAGLAGESRPAGWSVEVVRRRLRVETHEERGPYNAVLLSPLLGLSATDVDPDRAARLANGWAESFQEVSRRFKDQGSQALASALEDQAAAAAARLAEAEEALRAFRERTGPQALAQEARAQAESLAAVRAARLQVETDIESTAAVLASVERELGRAASDGEAALAGRVAAAAADLEASARALREYRSEADAARFEDNLEAARARLEACHAEMLAIEARLARAAAEEARVGQMLEEASSASPATALRTSLSDPAADPPADRLADLALLEQIQGRALESLRDRYYQARVDAQTLGPLLESYGGRVAGLQEEIRRLEDEAARRRDDLDRLTQRRDRALRRAGDLGDLQRKLHADVASLAVELRRLEARAEAQRRREADLRAGSARLEALLAEARLREEHLEGELRLIRDLHNAIAARAEQARAVDAGPASDVSIVSRAVVPERPVSPRPLWNLLAAALFGLAASSALVLLAAGEPRG
jgi:uncharacterized protein involved in exopolysaccharide biosynthesis